MSQAFSRKRGAVEGEAGAALRRWHNPLPGWILHSPNYRGDEQRGIAPLDAFGRLLLQTIADACDRPSTRGGDLDGAYCTLQELAGRISASQQTVRRRVKQLVGLGYLVRKLRGGDLRVATKTGVLTLASSYRIPGVSPGAVGTHWVTDSHPPPSPQSPTPFPAVTPPSLSSSLNSSFDKKTIGVVARQKGKKQGLGPIAIEQLKDGGRLGELYLRAEETGVIGRAEADAVWFFSAAAHALRIGTTNPCGLFVTLLRDRAQKWLFVTAADEAKGAAMYGRWLAETSGRSMEKVHG
jgi:hypothetical protein